MFQYLFAIALYIFNINCHSIPTGSTIEVIELSSKQYYPSDTGLVKPFWSFTDKIWFWDSLTIEEVRELNIHEEYKGPTHSSYDIRHYRFCDLRKKSVYEFCTFEESPQFLRKYSFDDSVLVVGGWGFNHSRKIESPEKVLFFSDTLIDGKNFKRATILNTYNKIPYTISCYFDCSRIGSHFSLLAGEFNTTGCPVSSVYYSSPSRTGLHMINTIKQLSNELTPEERSVFKAWKAFADKNPVSDR